jgi:hypothetical protein
MQNNNIIEDQSKIIKIEVLKNYIVSDYKNPPNTKILRYVRKEVITKHGERNLITFAVVKEKDGSTKLIPTSLWRPINSKAGKRILRYYLKKYPKKVKFSNDDLRQQFIKENQDVKTKSITIFMENYF